MKADKFIKRIYHRKFHIVNTCAVGVNQSGKTDLNLFIMERLHALGLGDGYGSNTPLKAPFDIDFIEDFQSLKHRCMMLNPNPEIYGLKRYFFNWGEMGKSIAQDMPWENTKFIKEMQLLRKYGLCILGDGIDRIDKRVFSPSHFHGYFEKKSKTQPDKAIYFDWTKRGKKTKIEGIPKTTIKYSTYYPAVFLWDAPTPNPEGVFLNQEHQIVKKYLDCGQNMKDTGYHRQEVKRAIGKVLGYHFTHCLRELAQDKEVVEPIEAEIA